MERIEVIFDFSYETKNNYVFEQAEGQKRIMFPNKIYLSRELFKKAPARVTAIFEPC